MASKPNKIVICPGCGNEQAIIECRIGILGNLEHCRCRYCGAGFSHKLKAKPRYIGGVKESK